MVNQLTKQSSESEVKAYFIQILNLVRSGEEFPVNLEDVWPLVYAQKGKAVQTLLRSDLFVEGIDYQVFSQKVKNSNNLSYQNGTNILGGRPSTTYMLSVPCLEFFIARKVRPVFEVYRKVFHKVASGAFVAPTDVAFVSGNLEGTLTPLSRYHNAIMDRFEAMCHKVDGYDHLKTLAAECAKAYRTYRVSIGNLVYNEASCKLDGEFAFNDSQRFPWLVDSSVEKDGSNDGNNDGMDGNYYQKVTTQTATTTTMVKQN